MITGWFACFETGDGVNPEYPWQPVLQLDGYTLSTDTWFKTEAECIGFIQAHILGQPLLDT